MTKEENKQKIQRTLPKLKNAIAVTSMVVGSVSDAYKGNTLTPQNMIKQYQKSQDLERRGQTVPAAPKQLPAEEEKSARRRKLMDQMRDRQAREKKRQKGKGIGISE